MRTARDLLTAVIITPLLACALLYPAHKAVKRFGFPPVQKQSAAGAAVLLASFAQFNIYFTNIPNSINPDGTVSYNLGTMTPTYTSDGSHLFSAAIAINQYITDPAAIAQVVAHELGHTFGLDDCPTCAANSSVMATPDTANSLNTTRGTDGPTPCDNAVVKQQEQPPSDPDNPPDGCSSYEECYCPDACDPNCSDYDECLCY
jgi:hypothetical protein